jgi:hypothetical protein
VTKDNLIILKGRKHLEDCLKRFHSPPVEGLNKPEAENCILGTANRKQRNENPW